MIIIKFGSWKKRGRWWWLYWVRPRENRQVVISCPKCGAEVRLNRYKIKYDGEVTPDFEHTCGFSEAIKLEDYDHNRN